MPTISKKDAIAMGLLPAGRRAKYRNEPIVVDGIRFDSKGEANEYGKLKLRKIAGEVLWFIRQPSFDLPGGIIYRADFLVCFADGRIEVRDYKSDGTRKIAAYVMKKKLMKATWGIDVVEVSKHGG